MIIHEKMGKQKPSEASNETKTVLLRCSSKKGTRSVDPQCEEKETLIKPFDVPDITIEAPATGRNISILRHMTSYIQLMGA